jgi:NAD(P)-dependent dehydrogenase (short-subunit alcohol dehydrogenase family)
MKIVLIGASGTIGQAVEKAFSTRHQVVRVGRTKGDFQVDLASTESINRLFERTAPFDAVICAAGAARFAPLDKLTDDDFAFSIANKLMGQVNVVRLGMNCVNDRGSFTLTSGVLAVEPMPGSAAISLVNAGLEGFVRAAALEMARGIRVNVVSPPLGERDIEDHGQGPCNGYTGRASCGCICGSGGRASNRPGA